MMMNRSTKTLVAWVAAIALLACGGSKPAEAPSPPAPAPVVAPTTPSATETPQQAATSGGIQIAQEILAACGIAASDAFPFDSSRLEKKDIKPLNDVAICFTSGPMKGRTLQLIGHADPRGATGYNMVLGQARADSVQKYLTNQGCDPGKVQSTSRGAMDATGTDEVGWAHDRRVDIKLGS